MTHPTQEDDVKVIRDALAEQLKSIEQAITDPENQPSQYGTVTLDFHLEKVKGWEDRFHRLSDQFDAQAARLEQAEQDAADAEQLAADRLDQMNADRKQALVWRDQAAKLFESLDGVVGLAVLGAAKITSYKAAIQGAQELIGKYRAAIASEAKT